MNHTATTRTPSEIRLGNRMYQRKIADMAR